MTKDSKNMALLGLLALSGIAVSILGDLSKKEPLYEEIPTETAKVAEIATETPQSKRYETRLTYNPDYGEPPAEVRAKIAEIREQVASTEESIGEIDENGYGWVALQYDATYHITENHLTRSNGVVYFNGHRETWYSIHEPGQTVTAREIPGKHIAEDGTIRDEDGYICVASSDLPFYTIVLTSVGIGKVYDCGCSSGTIDIYTNW